MSSTYSSTLQVQNASGSATTALSASRLSSFVLALLLTASIGLNVLLARRVRQLTGPKLLQSMPAQLQVGAFVPPVTANTLSGHRETINYAATDRPTVLYVFTPQCGWCARNMDNFKALLKAKSEADRFIGLSLSQEGLAEYVRAHDLTIPIFTGFSSETMKTYKLGGTPQTLVISQQGQVLQNWRGAWTDKQKSDIEAFFHVNLPGLSPPPSKPTSPS